MNYRDLQNISNLSQQILVEGANEEHNVLNRWPYTSPYLQDDIVEKEDSEYEKTRLMQSEGSFNNLIDTGANMIKEPIQNYANKKVGGIAGSLGIPGAVAGQKVDQTASDLKKGNYGKALNTVVGGVRTLTQSVDLYDIILSHLLDEGYADTEDSALVIMANMSEDWRDSIVEDIAGNQYTSNPIGNIIKTGAGLVKRVLNGTGPVKRDEPLWDGPETPTKPPVPKTQLFSYQWPSAKTLKNIADAYSSVYEKKEYETSRDKDEDGDNDFADNMIARMVASGMSREEAIKKVKNKDYNIGEATRMRKELGKEGEIETRKKLAKRSNAYQRSGSVDKTIAAAERGADRPYVANIRGESDADRAARQRAKSKTLEDLAIARRSSVRDKPRAGLRGYAANMQGSDRDLQLARSSAMAAGILTPREKKELNREEVHLYDTIISHLLEYGFADTKEGADVIIENMSPSWIKQILSED